MSKFEAIFASLFFCLLTAASPANAGGGSPTGGATEMTQIMNNGELIEQVRQQVTTVNQLAQSYVVQYNQLREQILAGTKIAGLSLSDVLKIKSEMEAYQGSLKELGRDLSSLDAAFDKRLVEAKLKNLSLTEYLAQEAVRVNSDNSAAKARLARERDIVNQVAQDIEQVKDYGRRIEGTVGVHESTQLLNGQMNLMLSQMTRLVTLTAEAQGSDKAQLLSDEAAARESMRSSTASLQKAQEELRNRDAEAFARMKQYKAPPTAK